MGAEGPLVRVVVIAFLCWMIYEISVGIRGAVHRWRLPEPSLPPGQLEMCQGQAFREICRRSASPGPQVMMTDYFAERGWNRADAKRILSEPLSTN
jgi:hypothetical protein